MADIGMNPAGESEHTGHLSESELAGFLDGALPPAERRRVEEHLDGCAECRGELVEMRRITNGYAKHASGSASRRMLPRWAVPAALAAGLAVLVLLPRFLASPSGYEPVRAGEPAGDGEGRDRIGVVSPAENATVAADAVTFTWHRAAADVYRISLLTESGEPMWSAETADTTIAFTGHASLRRGQPYFWRVDAITNGITATTGVHRLLVAP